MPTDTAVLEELRALGTAQTCKTYRRHGVGENVFGVSYGDLNKLHKRIKRDHALAQALWASGNHDARILATLIADPQAADDVLLDTWVRDLDNYVIAGAVAGFAAKTTLVRTKIEAWTAADDEWTGSVGWDLLGSLATHDPALSDAYFLRYLDMIRGEIHARKNRVRHAMNNAVIAIGLRNPALPAAALVAATQIGPVIVDHGATGCKTPAAAAYIQKTLEHRNGKAVRA